MSVEALIARYGLAAIFVGAGIEGEAVVVSGGVLAHEGLLPLVPTMVAAALGSCIVDQLWFIAGRRFRDHRWISRITERPAAARALKILERYPTGFIFAFRFIYGLRTVSPIAIGTSRVPSRKFMPLNALAAAIWGPLFVGLGYLLGQAAGPLLHKIAHVGLFVAIGAALVAFPAVGVVIALRKRRARKRGG